MKTINGRATLTDSMGLEKNLLGLNKYHGSAGKKNVLPQAQTLFVYTLNDFIVLFWS